MAEPTGQPGRAVSDTAIWEAFATFAEDQRLLLDHKHARHDRHLDDYLSSHQPSPPPGYPPPPDFTTIRRIHSSPLPPECYGEAP